MPITALTPRVPIEKIEVNREGRQRREIETKDLELSISRIGLITPIIVTEDLILKAGERRLTACRNLGWTEIPVTFFTALSPIDAAIVELEENIKRRDLDWQDYVRTIARIHFLNESRDEAWTQADTAVALSIDGAAVTRALRINRDLEDSRVLECKGEREAYNLLSRRDQRSEGEALQVLLDTVDEAILGPSAPQLTPSPEASPRQPWQPEPKPAPQSPIIVADFLQWAITYDGPKFNFLHCDFPYGIGHGTAQQSAGAEPSHGYPDTEDTYFALVEVFLKYHENFLSVSSHLMFWYSERHKERTLSLFSKALPQMKFLPHALIWVKSDNAGISPDHRRMPRHIYETCLLGATLARQIVEIRADAYVAPTDKTLHTSAKPEAMLRHFMGMLVDRETSMLDPTCGSGSSLRAAESLGAKRVFGLEVNPDFARSAQVAMANFRTLRQATRKEDL